MKGEAKSEGRSPTGPARQKRCGIWIRVSTEDQARGESPAVHEHRGREYAKFNDWEVVEVYDLAGVSGKSVMEHPEARRMMGDIARGHISAVIVSKLARLARNTRELLEFADFFRKHAGDIVSLQERIDTSTPAGRLFYTIIAAMAQWEREEIVDRVRASISTRARMGKSLGGAAPFGFEWRDGKLLSHPTEAPIRRLMFEWFAEDRRRKSVARRLNAAGYRTRKGAKFTDTTVLRLLQDPSAKGMYRSNHTYRDPQGKLKAKPETEWCHTRVEAIVSEELWNQCNALIESRREVRPIGRKTVHLFAGLLECVCGQRMYVFSRTSKYICSKCRTKIPMVDLEEIFREELREYFGSPDRLREHLARSDTHLEERRVRVAVHERNLEKVRSEMRRLYTLYQAEQISPEGFGKLYRPLEEQEAALASMLPRLQGELDALETRQLAASEVAAEAFDLYRAWPTLPPERQRQIIESIVERIVLSGSEIEIKLCYLPSSEEFTKRQRNLCAALPIDDRQIRVQRSRYLPSHIRHVPVPRNPTSLGGFLRRRRLELGMHQSEVARRLKVSTVTMSKWECDKIEPKAEYRVRIEEFLGFKVFQ